MWVDGRGVTQLARRIHSRHFAASAEARINTHDCASTERRLEEQISQIGGKNPDRMVVRILPQLATDFALDRWTQQAIVAILDCQAYLLCNPARRRTRPQANDLGDDFGIRGL